MSTSRFSAAVWNALNAVVPKLPWKVERFLARAVDLVRELRQPYGLKWETVRQCRAYWKKNPGEGW